MVSGWSAVKVSLVERKRAAKISFGYGIELGWQEVVRRHNNHIFRDPVFP